MKRCWCGRVTGRPASSLVGEVRGGFTLLEAVVAMAIIGVVSVGALGAFGADLRAAERAERLLPAAALAHERLVALEQISIGPLDVLPDSVARGEFDPPFDDYSWKSTAQSLRGLGHLVELKVEVRWPTGTFALVERKYDPSIGVSAR